MPHALKYEFTIFADYLQGEQDAPTRHEYVDGQIYAMSGASATHNIIAGELFAALHSKTEPPCHVFISDMKVLIKQQDKQFAYYPDLMVSCEKDTDNAYYREQAILLVEVLSPATQRTDLGEKLANYTLIPKFARISHCVARHTTCAALSSPYQLES
ncbi:Uma2 family endonuclease [Thiolinea disciformis]|uniref:Uma2 family endonuclease n=1 Tax=Thiolinea disciformis TaxID=125614 RepID=UPI0003A156FF|nr:Uma2 family endonuclease [Thiolinea disciformis]